MNANAAPPLGMRTTWLRPFVGVARRELTVMFTSPLAFIAVAVFTLLTALLFWLQLLQFEATQTRVLRLNDPSITALLDFNDLLLAPVFLFAQIVLLFIAPLLCMRLFAIVSLCAILKRLTMLGLFMVAAFKPAMLKNYLPCQM